MDIVLFVLIIWFECKPFYNKKQINLYYGLLIDKDRFNAQTRNNVESLYEYSDIEHVLLVNGYIKKYFNVFNTLLIYPFIFILKINWNIYVKNDEENDWFFETEALKHKFTKKNIYGLIAKHDFGLSFIVVQTQIVHCF